MDVCLQKFDGRSRMTSFASVEIHATAVDTNEDAPCYRVFIHRGVLERRDKVKW